MTDYRIEAPAIIRDFLTYHETIQGHSQKTVDEYYLDLRNFFRYIKLEKGCVPRSTELDDISIEDVNLELIRSVRLSDIYAYMSFLSRDRVRNARRPDSGHGLQASTRARKVATIRSFYKYLTNKAKLLEENPMQDLDSPRQRQSLPRYRTLEESIQLLESVDGENAERDFCILTLFLNCGLRISELCGLNLTDIHYMIKKRLTAAGLDSSKYSAHKLRHTAATLMLQNGVDVRTLQEVLGHEHLNTTQIYTHVNSESMKSAAQANPLGTVKRRGRPKKKPKESATEN